MGHGGLDSEQIGHGGLDSEQIMGHGGLDSEQIMGHGGLDSEPRRIGISRSRRNSPRVIFDEAEIEVNEAESQTTELAAEEEAEEVAMEAAAEA